MKYSVTRTQYKKLEGLAYWIAESAYPRERGDNKNADKTIRSLFNECDRLQIPFIVQNAVIEFGRNWRRYKSEYLSSILEVAR